MVINQTSQHKAKIYNQCTYTLIIIKKIHNYIKKFLSLKYKNFFVPLNIRMINLSFGELRLIAQMNTNLSDCENKSIEDLIKVLSKPKSERKPEERP